jgi:CheY-like chemotaxis protein
VRPHRGSSRHGGMDPAGQLAGRADVAARSGAGDAELEAHASHAAHQLGEAVVLLSGTVERLRADARAVRGVDGALDVLAGGVARARRYVDDLLDVLATAGVEPEPVDLDLAPMLEAARDELADAFARARATLDVGTLPEVRLDRRLAERLCAHLLRGGLAAADGRPIRIAVSGEAEGTTALIEIADDGAPLAPDAAAGFFDAFAAPRGRGPMLGAGVSPAVCRRIAQAHGGAIAIRPAAGRGAVVTLTLPASAPGRVPLRVLLCDDAAELRALLRWAFEQRPAVQVVGEASDGAGAVAQAAALAPDVVVLDLEMPGLGPAAVLEALRAAAPQAALVTFSGHEPARVAGTAAALIDLHVPKTTDLGRAAQAIEALGIERRD